MGTDAPCKLPPNSVLLLFVEVDVWQYTRIGMHLLFVGHYQDEGISFKKGDVNREALEEGYLEHLFLKESHEQGAHFDAPASIAKIVRHTITHLCLIDS